MITTTVKFHIEGDSYEEILDRGKTLIAGLLDIPVENVLDRANIEFEIYENELLETDMSYVAKMTARLKNV